ncbi:MAG: arylsulfatase [Planctomycetota bacterium]|nr:arylsulfatase [Planctomycetota bacterium]
MFPVFLRGTALVAVVLLYLPQMALVLVGLCGSALGQVENAAAKRPNLIVILADDMGFSDLGCYGGEIQTPVLDSLAANGLRFTQFYNTARCCPTRASLLTGLHPHQAGMGHMTGGQGEPEGYAGNLNTRCVTIAEVLRPAGYRTYLCGKWHVTRHAGPAGPKHNWPLERGFQKFYGTIAGGGSYYDPTTLCRGDTFITPDNDLEYQPQRFYYTDAISDNAVKFLQEHQREPGEQPFFLYVAYTAAHWPMHAPPEDIAKYQGKYDGGYEPIRAARFARQKQLGLLDPHWPLSPQAGDWESVVHKAWEARCMEVYAAMVDRMDQGLGRIVAELRRSGRLEDTLILFLQDNGGCAEEMGRQSNADKIRGVTYPPFAPDDLQPAIWPPMQTRDGRPVRTGPDVMPGPPDTYIAYGRAWANVSNTPFREYKHWVHEGGIATPLIAHWPRGIAAQGELRRQPGQLPDIMATCVDVAGARYPEEYRGQRIQPLEGTSLVPCFSASSRSASPRLLFWEHEGNRAVRVGDWKLVAKSPGGSWELYNLATDRTEMNDLAAQQPARVQELAARWETWARRAGVLPWIWKPAYGQPTKPALPR